MAATIETVNRVGPCEADITLIEIRDVRETKRKQIIERAAELLKEWDSKATEPREIEEKIDTDIKLGEIISWGPDQLPAGPKLDDSEDIIIVEGRADVLNLLRINIKNTVAVQGTQVPKSIIDLTKKKNTVIAFLDGDRGGTIILNELLQVAKIDFVARAPEGFEVEELTRKQMIKALQNKKLISEIKDKGKIEKEYKGKEDILNEFLKKQKIKNKTRIIDAIKNIEHGYSIGFNKKGDKMFEIPVSEIFEKIRNYSNLSYLIVDGILTDRLLSISINMNINFIACKNKEEKLKIPEHILVFLY